ncbi:MAG TPA: hypothetical protein VJN63_00505 [Thermoplasmata archaeon]|nr:hypothetical protein [Thermoplasmata archaeon]
MNPHDDRTQTMELESTVDPRFVQGAGVAGLLLIVLVFAYEVIGPVALAAAPRPSGSLDRNAVNAYYAHPGLAPLALVGFATAPLLVYFFFALRERLSDTPRARLWATLGLSFVVAEVPLIVGGAALHGAMVTIASGGGDAFPLFRFWDLYWNSGSYLLEASFMFPLAVAMRNSVGFSARVAWMTTIVGLLLAGSALVLWAGLPSAAAFPSNLAFAAWFVFVAYKQLGFPRRSVASPAMAR